MKEVKEKKRNSRLLQFPIDIDKFYVTESKNNDRSFSGEIMNILKKEMAKRISNRESGSDSI